MLRLDLVPDLLRGGTIRVGLLSRLLNKPRVNIERQPSLHAVKEAHASAAVGVLPPSRLRRCWTDSNSASCTSSVDFSSGKGGARLFSASSIRAHLLYGDRLDACLLWMRGSCMLRSNNLNMQGCMHTSFALMSCHASARAKHVQHRPPVADPGFLEWVFRVTNASDRCLSFACLI